MRIPTSLAPIARSGGLAVWPLVLVLVAACGSAAPTPPPAAPSPTPKSFVTATPWPPLTDPATADDVFSALLADGLILSPNGASAGAKGKEPVKKIDAIYLGWPLSITQYSTTKAARSKVTWKDGSKPGKNEPPIAFLGENVLVTWGPVTDTPPTPVGTQVVAAEQLRISLERLLGPLRARTSAPVAGASPSATAAPSGAASPAASPSGA
jgi:hypothetical protein